MFFYLGSCIKFPLKSCNCELCGSGSAQLKAIDTDPVDDAELAQMHIATFTSVKRLRLRRNLNITNFPTENRDGLVLEIL